MALWYRWPWRTRRWASSSKPPRYCFDITISHATKAAQPLVVILMQMHSMFTLSWILTWFSHNLTSFHQVCRIFDYLLASHPVAPVYLAAAVIPLILKNPHQSCEKDDSLPCTHFSQGGHRSFPDGTRGVACVADPHASTGALATRTVRLHRYLLQLAYCTLIFISRSMRVGISQRSTTFSKKCHKI